MEPTHKMVTGDGDATPVEYDYEHEHEHEGKDGTGAQDGDWRRDATPVDYDYEHEHEHEGWMEPAHQVSSYSGRMTSRSGLLAASVMGQPSRKDLPVTVCLVPESASSTT